MIRILQVFSKLNRGGAETMVMNIYRAIDKSQIQFDFIANEDIVFRFLAYANCKKRRASIFRYLCTEIINCPPATLLRIIKDYYMCCKHGIGVKTEP